MPADARRAVRHAGGEPSLLTLMATGPGVRAGRTHHLLIQPARGNWQAGSSTRHSRAPRRALSQCENRKRSALAVILRNSERARCYCPLFRAVPRCYLVTAGMLQAPDNTPLIPVFALPQRQENEYRPEQRRTATSWPYHSIAEGRSALVVAAEAVGALPEQGHLDTAVLTHALGRRVGRARVALAMALPDDARAHHAHRVERRAHAGRAPFRQRLVMRVGAARIGVAVARHAHAGLRTEIAGQGAQFVDRARTQHD